MVDAFAMLGQPRQPWLDPEALKSDFHRLATPFHPDHVDSSDVAGKTRASEKYAELNAAYQTLKEPRDRLLHLLELESGSPPRDIQRIPPGTMDLFVEIGQTCREVDGVAAGRREVSSPMLKLQQMQETIRWTARLQELQRKVHARRDEWHAELLAMNPVWNNASQDPAVRKSSLPLERLEMAYRALSYAQRWTAQIQERIVALMT